MVTRITAEFDGPETAELALGRIRDSVKGVYSASYAYNRISDRAQMLSKGTMFTVLPTGLTRQNYMTALMESPTSDDIIPEPEHNRKTTVYIVCDGSGCDRIKSILNGMGALNINSPR